MDAWRHALCECRLVQEAARADRQVGGGARAGAVNAVWMWRTLSNVWARAWFIVGRRLGTTAVRR